jgi:hypothetical protein
MEKHVTFLLPKVPPAAVSKASKTMDTDTSTSSDDEDSQLIHERRRLTPALYEAPYDTLLYLERAAVYGDLGYPDLAASDAYRALLLTDEVLNDGFEYHEESVEALRSYTELTSANVRRLDELRIPRDVPAAQDGHMELDEPTANLAQRVAIRCFQILALNLLLCGCWKSAYDFASRGLVLKPGDEKLVQAQEYVQNLARTRLQQDNAEFDPQELPDQGLVRREIYPWNYNEPDRFTPENLEFLNNELSAVAPKCAVQISELPVLLEGASDTDSYDNIPTNKQLGVFATEDIAPGELVLDELSMLTANNLLKEDLCDACSQKLPELGSETPAVPCDDYCDVMFCTQTCHDRAMESYHPAVCDKGIDEVSKDPDNKDVNDSLYFLLLARAIAMAAHQDVHPLNLKEVKFIWGDFLPSSTNAVPLSPNAGPPPIWTLPFSFKANIAGPLHILEKMDINIFENLRMYDTWVFNTLYAKFRGTASAKPNTKTGKPEVAAVHPLWCLANHDCDPNVRWDYDGRMRLWVRDQPVVMDRGCNGATTNGHQELGIRKGQEILSHYCDVELSVKERREWAKGALGGWCMCARCRREAAAEEAAAAGANGANDPMGVDGMVEAGEDMLN